MTLLIKVLLLLSVMNLSGCAFLNVLKQNSPNNEHSTYPSLKTFEFEGAVIHYKDLSDPCDQNTVAWNDLNEVALVQSVSLEVTQVDCNESASIIQSVTATQFEVQHKIKISFASKQTQRSDADDNESFADINNLVLSTTQFQIYGAAGTVGKRSEALGLARAIYVRDQLISMGIQHERISIMPYDSTLPGLQAVVEILEPVVL